LASSRRPFGALRLLGEGNDDARSGHWLCADPVHLRFHQERIILADAGAFELDDEAKPWRLLNRSMPNLPTSASSTSPAPGAGIYV
jgi:hypothetical protein